MASIISVDTLQDSAGSNEITTANVKTAFDNRVKAWVNFDGTGTIAVRDSQNISSLTDFNTATYGTNFTSNMNNANFSVSSTCQYSGGGKGLNACLRNNGGTYPLTTADAHFYLVTDSSVSVTDNDVVVASIHGDLA